MTLSDDIELLGRITLFDGFPAEQLRLLAFGSRRLMLRGGEVLFQEGDASDGGYVIVKGQLDLTVMTGNRETILSSQLAGSLVGEVALVTSNRRVTSAIARTNCELIFIPRELFLRMLREYPQLAASMHRRLADAVRLMMKDIGKVHHKMQTIPDLYSDGQRPDGES
ncbi:cyclic nucleotide-binding domain-containing protein [Salaquimonas pukyongi]|uniref:cyclic nucleotide-binding domain-containing protein n=1 Tax=Salaquimonas pukyongi TaxID=2712698 RepID=UPI00096BABFD|nr:cyclic nucleotide-binding domain-containing protein [Salaquimonas pukyongi]